MIILKFSRNRVVIFFFASKIELMVFIFLVTAIFDSQCGPVFHFASYIIAPWSIVSFFLHVSL